MALPVGVVAFGGDSPGGSLPTAPRGHRDSRAQVTGRPLPVARTKDAIRLHGSTRVLTGSCHIVPAAGCHRTRPGPGRLSRKGNPGRGHGAAGGTANHRSRQCAQSARAAESKATRQPRPRMINVKPAGRVLRHIPRLPDLPVLADCLLSGPSLRCHVYGVLKVSSQQLVKSA